MNDKQTTAPAAGPKMRFTLENTLNCNITIRVPGRDGVAVDKTIPPAGMDFGEDGAEYARIIALVPVKGMIAKGHLRERATVAA